MPEIGSDGYTAEIHDKMIERLMLGRSLLSICRDDDMPSHATILRWRKRYPELDEAIPRARAEGAHVLAEQCLDIADNPELEPQDRRVRIDTRLRLIGKWNARAYGDKLAIGGADDLPAIKTETRALDVIEGKLAGIATRIGTPSDPEKSDASAG